MKKRLVLAALLGTTWLLSACSSTQLSNQWTDSRFVEKPLHHVLVFSRQKNIGIARALELDISQRLGSSTRATPAYEVFGDQDITTLPKAQVRATLQSKGIDGLLMTGVTRVTSTEKFVPPQYDGDALGFWSDGWGGWRGWDEWADNGWGGAPYRPGYNYLSTSTYVQGTLYDVKDGQPVWTAETRTTDPSSLENVRQNVIDLISSNLLRSHVLAP